MKNILILLVLLGYITAQPSETRLEEMRKRREEHDKQMSECILKSESASAELKQLTEKNKDDDFIKVLHPRDHKLDKNDREVIRECRKQIFDKNRDQLRKDMERMKKDTEGK